MGDRYNGIHTASSTPLIRVVRQSAYAVRFIIRALKFVYDDVVTARKSLWWNVRQENRWSNRMFTQAQASIRIQLTLNVCDTIAGQFLVIQSYCFYDHDFSVAFSSKGDEKKNCGKRSIHKAQPIEYSMNFDSLNWRKHRKFHSDCRMHWMSSSPANVELASNSYCNAKNKSNVSVHRLQFSSSESHNTIDRTDSSYFQQF